MTNDGGKCSIGPETYTGQHLESCASFPILCTTVRGGGAEALPSSPIRSGISNATCQGPVEVSDQWGDIGVFGTGEAAVKWWLVSGMDGLSSGD